MDACLKGSITKVDHNQSAVVAGSPAPGAKLPVALVVGPTRAGTEHPVTGTKHGSAHGVQKSNIESLHVWVGNLRGPTRQENGHARPAAFQLALMKQPGAGDRGHQD